MLNKLFIALLLLSMNSMAQKFFDIDTDNINFTPGPNWSQNEKNIVIDMLEDFETEGSETIDAIDTGDFLQSTAGAQAQTHSLIGVDHASEFKYFLFGATASAAIDLGGKSIFDALTGNVDGDDFKGFSTGASLIAGMNISNKTQIYLNGFKFQASKEDFSLSTTSLGFRVRHHVFGNVQKKYRIYKRKPASEEKTNFDEEKTEKEKVDEKVLTKKFNRPGSPIARWGGIKVNSGLQFSNLNIGYSKDLNLSETVNQAGITVTGNLDTTVNASINSKMVSIPLEVSTYVDLLYFLTPYVGIGANINSGSTKGSASLSNTTVDIEKSGGVGSGTATTNARVNFEDEGKAKLFDPKVFLGLQINLWKLKIGAQYDKSIGGNSEALSATVRLAF